MSSRLPLIHSVIVFLLLSSCATFRGQHGSFFERGIASWYGKNLQGHKTSSGERFDMKSFTAAHRTLPFGTVVQVKSLSTGKTVSVRINDRGPFVPGRVIDLSRAAAERLDIVAKGEDTVEISN